MASVLPDRVVDLAHKFVLFLRAFVHRRQVFSGEVGSKILNCWLHAGPPHVDLHHFFGVNLGGNAENDALPLQNTVLSCESPRLNLGNEKFPKDAQKFWSNPNAPGNFSVPRTAKGQITGRNKWLENSDSSSKIQNAHSCKFRLCWAFFCHLP